MNFNKVFLAGRLTRDPELRTTPSGTSVADLGLAVNRKFKDKEETVFVDVTAWARQAEVIAQYLKKGDPLFLSGRLTYESWDDGGKKRSRLKVTLEEFQFVGGKRDGDAPVDKEGARRVESARVADEIRKQLDDGTIPF